ncbi:MAG TPA: hypothetical protein VK481_09865 [Gemmatimonadaceae bacterium]|nr:hypothetical protein [Gemmatimonadaceae bacterium]
MLRFARVLLLVVPPVAIAGCQARAIIDDFGTNGYARIEGKVTRANGAPLANSGVFYLCGPDAPSEFGSSVPTDASGDYFIDLDVPGPTMIPASGALRCRFSAPTNAVPIVSVERSIQFSAKADARPLTIVDLLEP